MVSDHERRRARYVAGSEGAPPVPPPGGYRGARRDQEPPAPPRFPTFVAVDGDDESGSGNALGWIALCTSILFALVLLATLLAGGTDVLYGVTMLAVQLVVLAVVIGAIVTRRGRTLGAIALVIAVLFNVATVGGLSALQTSASGSYDGAKSDEQRHAEAYPGIKGTNPQDVLDQASLEEVRAEADSLFADIRQRLSDRFGYTWVQISDEDLRPERNGYGGESMLYEYTSVGWATNEPIQDYDRKLEVMAVANEVVAEHGLWELYAFNDPAQSGIDPGVVSKMYGSDDPRTQHTWESYTENFPEPLRFYTNIFDLSNDPTGDFRLEREAQSARTGEPLEGMQLFVLASAVLSDDDRATFEEKLKDYPGF